MENKIITKNHISHRLLRVNLLMLLAISIIMTIIATFMYPPLLTMPHFYSYILKLGLMLFLHTGIVILGTRHYFDLSALKTATFFGIIVSLVEIVHILIEDFGHMDGHTESVSTGIFMVGEFLLFGVAGFFVTLRKGSIIPGMLAGSWSSVVCMLIVMTFGLSQLFWSFGAMEKHNIGNPDFIRTGWTDLHAFTIADIFEACFKILFVGPIVGLIFGLLGAGMARFVSFIVKKVQA